MTIAFGFGIAILISLISMPLIIKIAHSRKLYDVIDDRKIHTGNIPRLGGLGIFLAFVAAIAIITVVTGKGVETGNRFWAVILCMLVIHVVGLVDDFRNLAAVYKFIIELAAAIILSALGFRFMAIVPPFAGLTFGLGASSYPITVIWIIGVTNAVNLIDGMDGLAGGISAFAAAAYGLIFVSTATQARPWRALPSSGLFSGSLPLIFLRQKYSWAIRGPCSWVLPYRSYQ